jgi:hypothetical protein
MTMRLPHNWPRTAPFIVWSHFDGRWWRVATATDLDNARMVAALRWLNAVNGTSGNRALGTRPMIPRAEARFVATTQYEDPEKVWQAQQQAARQEATP